jgi:hypothetical protein
MPLRLADSLPSRTATLVSPDDYGALDESLILDPESTTGWVIVNGSSLATDAANKTLGTVSVAANGLQAYWDNNPDLTAKAYVNLTSAAARGGYSHIALDLRWNYSGVSTTNVPSDAFELFASTADDVGGTVVTSRFPYWTSGAGIWKTCYIDVRTLTSVKCLGVRSIRVLEIYPEKDVGFSIRFDNIRWASQTELEAALGAGDVAVVTPDYVPSVDQKVLAPSTGKTILDLRPAPSLSGADGVKSPRDFQITAEDGSEDVTTQILDMFSELNDGDVLRFPASATYLLDTDEPLWIRYLTNVTIDGNGATLYTTFDRENPFITLYGCRNVTVRGFRIIGARPEVRDGSVCVAIAGTPTVSGTTIQLNAEDEEVRGNIAHWARNKDGYNRFDIALSDSAQVASDCWIGLVDDEAPATAPVAAAFGSTGPMEAGTYHYRVTYLDAFNQETCAGPSVSVTLATPGKVDLTSIPVAAEEAPEVVARHIYRTKNDMPDDPHNYYIIGALRDNTTTIYRDTFGNDDNAPNAAGMAAADGGTGNVEEGLHYWRVSFFDSSTGLETIISQGASQTVTLVRNAQVSLTGIPLGGAGVTARRIYRTKTGQSTGEGNFFYVGEIADNTTTVYTDNIADASLGDIGPELVLSQDMPWLPSRTLTLTGSQTTYSLIWDGRVRPETKFGPRIKKLTATANTISVHSITQDGRVEYSASNEFCHGIQISQNNEDCLVEDCYVEGVSGDGVLGSGTRTTRCMVRGVTSRGARRQGMSFNDGSFVVENCQISETGRSGIDIEPPSGLAEVQRLVLRDIYLRSIGNSGIACGNEHLIANMIVERVRMWGGSSAGTADFFGGGAEILTMKDCSAPYWGMRLNSAQPYVDGLEVSYLTVAAGPFGDFGGWYGGGGAVMNVRLTDRTKNAPLTILASKVSVSNVSHISAKDVPIPSGGATAPFQVVDDTGYGILDPQLWRQQFPSTYKGVIAGNLWFPRGLDLRDEPVLRTRALGGSTVRGNNLRAVGVTLGTGVTSKAVTFPTRTNPALGTFTLTQRTSTIGGTLTTTTYFYRVAARGVIHGPSGALTEKSVTLSGANNAVEIALNTLRTGTTYIEGATIYRGTSAGVYNVRYDLVPNHDLHGLGAENNDNQAVRDLGTTLQLNTNADQLGFGYDDPLAQTTTTGHPSWTGSAWTVADETGYEPDTSYDVWVTTSFNNGGWWITNKTRAGFTVNWVTATADANQTLSWLVVR